MIYLLLLLGLLKAAVAAIDMRALPTEDYAAPCYNSTIPPLTPNYENRTIPWGCPSFRLPNNTLCCGSLSQVRNGIDEVDKQLLALLAQRVAYG